MLRSLPSFAILVALAFLAPAAAHGQEPARPDTVRAQPERPMAGPPQHPMGVEGMGGMMPMMTEVMHHVTRSTMAALAEPETARNLARFTRNYYTALVAEGFSEEQAMRIVSSMGFPVLPGM